MTRARRKPVGLDVEALAPVLHEVMPIGDGEKPSTLLGFLDRTGQVRRIRADYPNGWRLTVRLNAKFEVTSTSASLKLTTEVRG